MKRYNGLHDKLCTIENMTGVFMLKIEKKKLNLKHNIL